MMGENIYDMMEQITLFFENSLYEKENQEALKYLYSRGLDDETIKLFRIGYSPNQFDACTNWAESKEYSLDELTKTGVVRYHDERQKFYDAFKGRIIFPICDIKNRVIGFSARTLDNKEKRFKYINTPNLHKINTLYGLNIAKDAITENKIIICEGVFDVFAMHKAGFKYAVSLNGTSLSEAQAFLIASYSKKVYLAFDADFAGQRGILGAVEMLLPLNLELKIIKLSDAKDLRNLSQKDNSNAIKDAVKNSVDWIDFVFNFYQQEHRENSTESQIQIFDKFIELLTLIEDEKIKKSYIYKIADIINIDDEEISQALNLKIQRNTRRERLSGNI